MQIKVYKSYNDPNIIAGISLVQSLTLTLATSLWSEMMPESSTRRLLTTTNQDVSGQFVEHVTVARL